MKKPMFNLNIMDDMGVRFCWACHGQSEITDGYHRIIDFNDGISVHCEVIEGLWKITDSVNRNELES